MTYGKIKVDQIEDSSGNVKNVSDIGSGGSIALNDVTNVSAASPNDNDVLTYDSATSSWVAEAAAGGGATSLDGLSDVAISSPSIAHTLRYNGSNFVNVDASTLAGDFFLEDTGDVNIDTYADGDILVWDDNNGEWVNQQPSGGGSVALNDVTNVSVASPSDNDVLTYDSASQTWVAEAAPGGGGSHTLGSHSDISFGTLTTGNLIRWNGSAWTNVTGSTAVQDVYLGDLANANIDDNTTLADGHILVYDETNDYWVNQAPSTGGGGGATELDDLSDAATWNSTQGIAIGQNAGATIISNNGTNKCIAIGFQAVQSNQYGQYTTAVGQNAAQSATSSNNTCIGYAAGQSLTSGQNNLILGSNAAASSNTVSNEITLGDSNITSLRCAVTSITSISDSRDKKDVADINVGLDFINAVRPVSFEWDLRERQPVFDENDNQIGEVQPRAGLKEYGFIAQELQAVQTQFGTEDYSRLVNSSNPDKLEADTFRLFPIMVKAVQELSAANAALEARIAALEGN